MPAFTTALHDQEDSSVTGQSSILPDIGDAESEDDPTSSSDCGSIDEMPLAHRKVMPARLPDAGSQSTGMLSLITQYTKLHLLKFMQFSRIA